MRLRMGGRSVENVEGLELPMAAELLRRSLGCGQAELMYDFRVEGITCDSRQVQPGYIFIAIPGLAVDGAEFAYDAVVGGAQFVVTYRKIPDLQCPELIVPDPRRAAALLGASFYQLDSLPAEKVKLIGVTGTNGKTTVTYLLQHISQRLGITAGRLGTVEYDLVSEIISARHTTAEPIELCKMLRTAIDSGARLIALEVSSHALSQSRVAGLNFAAAVFTNLSGDHLDYHKTMDEYLQAKSILFNGLAESAWAVVNLDDEYSHKLIAGSSCKTFSYGIDRADADLHARTVQLSSRGIELELDFRGKIAHLTAPYIGKHNAYNILAALAAAAALGLDFDAAVEALASMPAVPGRLERIDHRGGFGVFVDYAHTDDGLDNVLRAVKPIAEGRVILVFGCGGDRDRGKRPRMAAVADRWADLVIVTSDNPRTEDPAAIIDEIVQGFSGEAMEMKRKRVRTEPDRARAIEYALTEAKPGDIVLIAGKGHETYQLIGQERIDFDDRVKARDALRGLGVLE